MISSVLERPQREDAWALWTLLFLGNHFSWKTTRGLGGMGINSATHHGKVVPAHCWPPFHLLTGTRAGVEKGATQRGQGSSCLPFLLLRWPASCCDSGRVKVVGSLRVGYCWALVCWVCFIPVSLPPWGRALQQLHGDFMIPQSRGSHLMEVF